MNEKTPWSGLGTGHSYFFAIETNQYVRRCSLWKNPKNWNVKEVSKLVSMLAAAQIPYEIKDAWGGKHIWIPNKDTYCAELDERRISVISFYGSYGGERGLLEIYAPGLNSGVEGYLDAKQAFDYIVDTRNGISRGSYG